jgi:hypothetical protein
MTSAYPAPLDVLIPQAQQLVSESGQLPSRNKLMTQFKIGARKATQILTALADAEPNPVGDTARLLHAVPDTSEPVTEPSRPDSVTDDEVEGLPSLSEPVNAAGNPPAPTAVGLAPADRSRWDWTRRMPQSWPLILLALPAFVAIWSGWVGLGELTGFGLVHPLPGIANGFTLNTAITLPVGVETYAAYALRVALAAGTASGRARWFAAWSAGAALVLGAAGQVAYHLMSIRHVTAAPWPITTAVACLPVVVLGCGAALAHLQRHTTGPEVSE